MLAVIGHLLPLALAVALSTVPMTAVITILLSPQTGAALPFMVGVLLGIFVVTGVFALGLRAVPPSPTPAARIPFAVGEIVVGIGLITYAVVLFARRRRVPRRTELPRWLSAVGRIRAVPAFGLGFALGLRPKALLLAAAAGLVVGPAQLGVVSSIVILAVYSVVGGSTVAVPVILTLARPAQMKAPLAAREGWVVDNSRTVTTVVALVIGTVVAGSGLSNV